MPRAGVSTDVVVQHAIAIIDSDGQTALTLARVADELGVSAPSLYKHIGGLDDLIERAAIALTIEFAADLGGAIRGRSGLEGLTALAHAYRAFARRHPGTYPLTQRRLSSAAWTAAAEDALTSLVAVLSSYGAGGDVDHIRFVRAALHGFVDLERTGGFGLPASVDLSFAAVLHHLDTALRQTIGAR